MNDTSEHGLATATEGMHVMSKSIAPIGRPGRRALIVLGALSLAVAGNLATCPTAIAQSLAPAPGRVGPPPGATTEGLQLEVGKSRLLETFGPYTDITIDDPRIADVLPLTKHSLNVIGRSLGSTTLTIYGPGKQLISSTTVFVGPDVNSLKAQLHDAVPDEPNVIVRAVRDNIVVSGTVASAADLTKILELAESFAPKKVVNMIGVEGTQQVMLSVRFVEMERSAEKDLRLSVNAGQTTSASGVYGGPGTTGFVTGDNLLSPGKISDTLGGAFAVFGKGASSLEVILDALETKNLVKTLAEPTLVAMSGDTASFLVGGELPIPVAVASGSATGGALVSIEFKQFGISLAFTPTILKDGMINLAVNPEVSQVDTTLSYAINGLSIPGFKVRRAKTTIELRDGESFTIAGLLSDNYQNTIRAFPIAGDVPVLGALFRSTGFMKDQTELVIVVTPHLATPRKGPIATPLDHFVPPSDYELFLFGSMQGAPGAMTPEDKALMSHDPTKGGVEGPYGHVVY